MDIEPEHLEAYADMLEGIAAEMRSMAMIARGIYGSYEPVPEPAPVHVTEGEPKLPKVDVSNASVFYLSQGQDLNAVKLMMRHSLIRDGVVGYKWGTPEDEVEVTYITRTETLDAIHGQ